MSILIKGMEMLTTGLYFVSVNNTDGRDKTVVTVERMLGNHDVRQIIGSFELVPIPPHGRCIDADALMSGVDDGDDVIFVWAITDAPTIIEADPEEEEMK